MSESVPSDDVGLSGQTANPINEVLFFDVPAWFWAAPYIEEAIKRGLLLARAKQWLMTFFKPYASVTRERV